MSGSHKPIPPAVVTAMLDCWGDGLSTKKIADMLGTTKNAVIGKINRLRAAFGARQFTLWDVAGHLERGGSPTDFDCDEPFGSFAVAEMRRKAGWQAR